MATPVEMAAPEMPHKGINNKLSTNTVITISTVKRTSYLYFFDVESLFFSKIIEEKCRSGKINIKEYEIKYIEIIKCG